MVAILIPTVAQLELAFSMVKMTVVGEAIHPWKVAHYSVIWMVAHYSVAIMTNITTMMMRPIVYMTPLTMYNY